MKCHRSYLISNFENFRPNTLKRLIFNVMAYGTVSVNEGSVKMYATNMILIKVREIEVLWQTANYHLF